MKPTRRVLVGIVASLIMAFVGFFVMGWLSQWIDSAFYQSKVDDGSLGFAFVVPCGLGAIAGLMSGLLYFIRNHKQRGEASYIMGVLGLGLCWAGGGLSIGHVGVVGTLILCVPSLLWMVGLILYGIWQVNIKRSL